MQPVRFKIIGTWRLVSMTYKDRDGKDVHFFGEQPLGVLTYDPNGIINVQFMKKRRDNFASDAYGTGSADEITQAFKSYQAYFGSYFEKEPGVIVHKIEGCIFPNWSGKEEIRYARIEGNKLTLTTPPTRVGDQEISVDAVWQRVQTMS
jgi:hypothetical protein